MLPFPVYPGRFYLITRRSTHRTFLLRPDAEMNNAFLYCLGEAAAALNITLILSVMMSNHHHTLVYDPDGNINEFKHRFHLMTAKCVNVLRDRNENMWTSDSPSTVVLVEVEDAIERLSYVALNPVKADLVTRVHHWPGPRCVSALMNRRSLRARRPHFFFARDSELPQFVDVKFEIPKVMGDPTEILANLRRDLRAAEIAHDERRRRTKRCVIGRSQIRQQAWTACPKSVEPRRKLHPRFAARNPEARRAVLSWYRAFVSQHADARRALLNGESVRFPAGTYWWRKYAAVETEPLPDVQPGCFTARTT